MLTREVSYVPHQLKTTFEKPFFEWNTITDEGMNICINCQTPEIK